MREVFIAQDHARVGYYKSILDEAGIPSFIRNQYTNNSLSDIPSAMFLPALCVVHDEDYDSAIQILGEIRNAPRSEAPDWRCPNCSGEVPGNFDSCWQCGALRAGSAANASEPEPAHQSAPAQTATLDPSNVLESHPQLRRNARERSAKGLGVIAVVLALAACYYTCHLANDQAKTPAAIIERALKDLAGRKSDQDAYVIFTDAKSEQFVQFTYEENGFLIDIPLINKTAEEEKRLGRLFNEVGINRPIVLTTRDPKTMKSFVSQSYQAAFASDTKKATEFALRLFREVFERPSPVLVVEEY
jgi:hypothetical protein